MKKFEVTVISKEIIKPSSPTPDFLGKHHLSYLDQISPPLYIPLIFFYSSPRNGVDEISNRLKKSLSQALTRFYPLAGKLVDRLYVDCNDDGVDFFEAQADIELSEILSNPAPHELNKFLPYEPNELRNFCMAVQISFLNCGSMAVGLMISHKIADAKSLCSFAYSWAAITSLEVEPAGLNPKFDAATIFPPIDNSMIFSHSDDDVMFKEKPVTKMFTFPISKVNALRDKYYANRKNGRSRRPTRVEALSTFLWSRLMGSTQVKSSNSHEIVYSSIGMVVNLRPRFDPPVDFFGNLWLLAGAMFEIKDKEDKEYEKESSHVVEKLGEAIRKVNGDCVAKLREGYSCNYTPNKVDKEGEPIRFGFTSFCRFPLYGVDFGWGEPVWVSSARWGICNVVTFLDNRLGDGIETWVNLNKEDMAKFEADKVLQEFVSSSPFLQLSYPIKTDFCP